MRVAAGLALAVVFCGVAVAQDAEPVIEYGIEQRVRNEQWDNLMDFDAAKPDARNQIRWRTRAWAKVPLTSGIEVAVGLTQETNQMVEPRRPWQIDEVVFETAYLEFKRLGVRGLSLRAGRQNLGFGEGFLLFEGNAWDGSRTMYHNALDLTYTRGRSRWDLLAISNPRQDHYLPVLHDRHRALTEWDEQAVGLYHSSALSPKTTVDAYYFWKREIHDQRPLSDAQFQPDQTIHTSGGRAVRLLPRGWSANAEMAVQWGRDARGKENSASAGYAYVKKSLGAAKRGYASAGYWGFSGDDPRTAGVNEGWDPMFARWPKWSELYLYSLLKERGVGYWTNLSAWQGELGYSPGKRWRARASAYRMTSFHPYTAGGPNFSSGTFRGMSYQARLDVAATGNWSGHVLYERFRPGGFYTHSSSAHFVRFELLFQVRGKHARPGSRGYLANQR